MNFHRSQLLTESDKRKYKELFAKLITANDVASLPVLSGIQTKSKVIKGTTATNQYNINMPTNLNVPLASEALIYMQSDTDETGVQVIGLPQANTNEGHHLHHHPGRGDVTNEGQIILLPTLTRNSKASVINVIKRHNAQVSDKII